MIWIPWAVTGLCLLVFVLYAFAPARGQWDPFIKFAGCLFVVPTCIAMSAIAWAVYFAFRS